MKTSWISFGVLAFAFATAAAQEQSANDQRTVADTVQKLAHAVTDRGAHHKVWERIEYELAPDGSKVPRPRRYTELATGLHFKNELGEWEESKEEIELLPDNAGAIARKGQHKAIFPAEIKSGLIELQTPDQKWMRSRVWGLAYFDSATGESVLLAEVQESEGRVVGDNVVLYPNAFTDFVADIRYTYMKAGFEQDVVFRENPPTPEELGLNPKTTRLQVLTEFVESPTPTRFQRAADVVTDETLGFGAMQIGAGKAFRVDGAGETTGHVLVDKKWAPIEGRDFLIEEVHYEAVTEQLQKLPTAQKPDGASLIRRGRGENVLAALKPLLPKRYSQAGPASSKPHRMAKAKPPTTPSFVMDYVTLTSQTNYTFKGDTTYYISGTVNLSGTTSFESGAVIKYASSATMTINGPLVCQTAAYLPVVFTAKDDNTLGETLSGSTGNPSGYYAATALNFNSPTGAIDLHDIRIRYATTGITIGSSSAALTHTIRNVQFGNVGYGLTGSYNSGATLAVQNGLFSKVGNAAFNSASSASATAFAVQHVTLDQAANIFSGSYPADSAKAVTNSLLVSVTNNSVAFEGQNNATNSSSASVFQTSGGGAYYLANSSSYRDTGMTNIDATLLASLKRRTTYPPMAYTNVTFTAPMTFNPQAQRDTDTPDLGYHYDPLDHSFGGCTANSNITFTAGTAVGWFRTSSDWYHAGHGLRLADRQVSEFNGTVTAPCYWVRLTTVQENDRTAGYGPGGMTSWASALADAGEVRARFLKCATLNYDANHFRDDSGYLTVRAVNSEFHNASIGGYIISMYFTNCLFFRNHVLQISGSGCSVAMQNCTMKGALFQFSPSTPSYYLVKDCAFDGPNIVLSGYAANASYATYDYNAYTNTSNPFPVGSTHNVPVSSSFNWQTGPLGNFYLPTNSTLINTGSVTAPNIALYHYSTQTTQTKEASSQVDIGYHYVAVDGNGLPLDSDSDGLVDYLEDANGDGSFNGNDLGDWSSADPDGDGVFDWIEIAQGRNPSSPSLPGATNDTANVTKLRVYTPLK